MKIQNQTYINTCSLSVISFILKQIQKYQIPEEEKNYIISLINDDGLSINNLETILSSYCIEAETFYVNELKQSDFSNNQFFILPIQKEDYWHYLVVKFYNNNFHIYDSSNNSNIKVKDLKNYYSNIIITIKKNSDIIKDKVSKLKINKLSIEFNIKYILLIIFISAISSIFSILVYLRIQVYINSLYSDFEIIKVASYFLLFIFIEIFIHFCSFLSSLLLQKIKNNNLKTLNYLYSSKLIKLSIKTFEDNRNIIKDFSDNINNYIDYFFKAKLDLLILLSNSFIIVFISISLGYLISIIFSIFILIDILASYLFSKYYNNNKEFNQFFKSVFKTLIFSFFLFTILFSLSIANNNKDLTQYSHFFYSFFIFNILSYKISNYFNENKVIFKRNEIQHIYNKFISLPDYSFKLSNYDCTIIYNSKILNHKSVNKIQSFDIYNISVIINKSVLYSDLNYSDCRIFHTTDALYEKIGFNVSDYDKNYLYKAGYKINYDEPGYLERILIGVISLINSKQNIIIFLDNSIISSDLLEYLNTKIKNKGRIYLYENFE